MNKTQIKEFLYQSNLIEGIDDDEMLEDSLTAWDYLMAQDELTTSVILKTHKIVMMKSNLYPNERGYFRKCNVRVGSYYAPDPMRVRRLVELFCDETMRTNSLDSKPLHVAYEKIHPFVDGNGRTGRMFMNWTRLKRIGQDLLIIKNDEKEEYYKWFK